MARAQGEVLTAAKYNADLAAAGAAFIINVKAFGALGDGVANDQPGIQAAINAAANGAVIWFPEGIYALKSSADNLGLQITGKQRLHFIGRGVIQRAHPTTDNTRIATFVNCQDIVIQGLHFDANGVTTFGGIAFETSQRLWILNTRFFDSNKNLTITTDRYSYVFSGDGQSDIWIVNNLIEDLQLEVDRVARAHILHNRIFRPVTTSGIGLFSQSTGGTATHSDITIAHNYIFDADISMGAITANIDPGSSNNNTFRRLTIAHNKIHFGGPASGTDRQKGITIGTQSLITPSTGNVFHDITIEDNEISYDPSASATDAAIFAISSSTANFVFNRLRVINNRVYANTRAQIGIDLRNVQYAVVRGNLVHDAANQAFHVNPMVNSFFEDNMSLGAPAIAAFQLNFSTGSNVVRNNTIIGSPAAPYVLQNITDDDYFEGGIPDAAQVIGLSGNQISSHSRVHIINATNDVTLASTPTVTLGFNGQHMTIINTGVNRVTLQDGSVLPSSHLRLKEKYRTLGNSDVIELVFLTATADWHEVSSASRNMSSSGTATIGAANFNVSVTHGLHVTPTLAHIKVTPTNNMGGATKFWVSNAEATTFQINVDNNPGGAGATFSWSVDYFD